MTLDDDFLKFAEQQLADGVPSAPSVSRLPVEGARLKRLRVEPGSPPSADAATREGVVAGPHLPSADGPISRPGAALMFGGCAVALGTLGEWAYRIHAGTHVTGWGALGRVGIVWLGGLAAFVGALMVGGDGDE